MTENKRNCILNSRKRFAIYTLIPFALGKRSCPFREVCSQDMKLFKGNSKGREEDHSTVQER